MVKRLLSSLMALCLVMTLLPAAALAAEGNVAKIGDQGYETLQAAVNDVPTDGTETTITLIDDVDGGTLTPSDTVVTVATIAAGQDITLDLAGHTISASLNTNGNNYAKAHVLLNNGTLTITDSSADHSGAIENTNSGSNACTRTVKNTGSLTITGGTISGTVVLLNQGYCLIDGENVVIKSEASFGGGGWDNSASAIEHRDATPVAANAGLTIKNATVSSTSRAAVFCDASSKFYIEGGTFTGNAAYGAVNGSSADNMAVITGGFFSSDPSNLIDQTAYLAVDRPSNYFEVVRLGTASNSTVATEADLLAQLNAASYAAPLNITVTGNITLNSSAELLSGSTITIASGASLTVAEGVVLTQSGLITNNGTLTINGFLTNPLNLTNHGTIIGLDLAATSYEIKTAMDLQWLTYLVEYGSVRNVTLANDITMPTGVEFQMIGSGNNGFYGNSDSDRNTFDGQNHTITGLRFSSTSSDVGLFTSLMYANIKNLTVEVDAVSNTGYAGGITGYAVEGVSFQNITVKGSVTVTGGSYGCAAIAAAVGNDDSANAAVEFTNCRSEAAVGGAYGYNIGSMFGTASGSGDAVYVYNCSNTGAITAADSVGYVFGFGYLNSAATLEIIGFANSGTVNGAEGSISSAAGSGFTYNTDKAGSDWIAVKDENGQWTAMDADTPIVASINGAPFASLAGAVSAAQSGDTIELLSDTTLTSALKIEKSGLTIDGKTHTITATAYDSGSIIGGMIVSNGGNTLKNMTVDLSAVSNPAANKPVILVSAGDTVDGVTVIAPASKTMYGISANGSGAENETVTIKNCVIQNCERGVSTEANNPSGSTTSALETLVVENCQFVNCNRASILYAVNTTFTGNKVSGAKLNILHSGQQITNNEFTNGSRISFYNNDITFTGNTIDSDSYLEFTSANNQTQDLTGNDFGEKIIMDLDQGITSVTVTLPTPTKDGYTFNGWYNGETKADSPYAMTGSTENVTRVTLDAKWTAIPSGGSSSSGSSGNKSETVTNPDGSTTTTVTKPDGSTTETTKNPDGSTEVVDTKKDGTVTTTTTDKTGNKTQVVENTDGSSQTTVTNKDGSSSTTKVDETGKAEAEVKLPASVVEDAAGKGEAVTLPMPQVSVTSDTESASTVTVDLPADTTAKVEIPVENVTAGTVAVRMLADGTDEIIMDTVATENGVVVTLSDGDTVKIVDNSKDFVDVPDSHWGSDNVDFVTSRELFTGTSATTFTPAGDMTRAMVLTVLARYEGVDTTTGGTWYEAGMDWAVETGISDGTNPMNSVTREQLALMLYRYADEPETRGSLSAFPDAADVSDWASDAMAWAVENGLITGMGNGTLNPQGTASRVEVAAMFMRFIENQNK